METIYYILSFIMNEHFLPFSDRVEIPFVKYDEYIVNIYDVNANNNSPTKEALRINFDTFRENYEFHQWNFVRKYNNCEIYKYNYNNDYTIVVDLDKKQMIFLNQTTNGLLYSL